MPGPCVPGAGGFGYGDPPAATTGAIMRTEWVAKRKSDRIRTQLYYARKGIVTEEMYHIARRESLPPELVRSEVGRGRMIIPANVNHPNLEPMCIGVASRCKINSNIGNSAVLSNVEDELEKLRYSVKYEIGRASCRGRV